MTSSPEGASSHLPVLQGAAMIPIRRFGPGPSGRRLVAMIEVGRTAPFRLRELAEVEGLVDALVTKADHASWL
jgi:hypothetical protein